MGGRKIVPKTSFLGGEAGPLLEGRSDLTQFQLGASTLRNFIAVKGGAITRRPPTNYVKTTQGNVEARLFGFVTDLNQTSGQFVVEVADPGSTTLTWRVIRVSGSNPVITPSGSPQTVARAVTNESFDTNDIQVTQNGLNMFVACKGFEPQILTMVPATASYNGGGLGAGTPTFVLAPYIAYSSSSRSEWFSMPYRTANISATTLAIDTASVGTGRTLTASTAIFSQSHIGAYFRVNATSVGYVRVTAVGGSAGTLQTTATVAVVSALGGTGATTDWSEGSWSEYRGWPRTITQYNGRLVFGGNTSEPDTFWMSQVDDYYQMSASTSGISDPLSFTLRSDVGHQIQWMMGGKKLTIGTTNSEWVGTVTNDGTNLSVNFDEETTHGSLPIKPTKYGYSIPFVQRTGQTVREMTFSFDADSYVTTDLNLFASHVGVTDSSGDTGEIKELAYQEGYFNTLWVRSSGGRLYGVTRDKQQQIAAWHSHDLGGAGARGTSAICVVRDTLWMVTQRLINGVSSYHVEYMQTPEVHPLLTDQIFLDGQKTSTASSTVTWSGFSHLASSNAYVVAWDADGNIVQTGVVAVDGSGVVTLTNAATTIVVGHHADAILRLLPFEGGDDPKIHMVAQKRADKAAVRLHETWGLRVGLNRIARKTGWEDNTTFKPIPFDSSEAPAITTFTGIKDVDPPTGPDHDGSFALAMQEPWPCTILSISSRVVSNEV